MPLCALCQSINFRNLPSIPACYEGRWASIKSGKLWVGFWNWQLKYQEGSRVPNASTDQTRLGLPYHRSLEDLQKAADHCPVCAIVGKDSRELVEDLHEAGYDSAFLKTSKQGPDWMMWLAKGPEHTDGFMVLSLDAGTGTPAYVLSAMMLSVCADDEPYALSIKGRVLHDDDNFELRFRKATEWLTHCELNHAGIRCSVGEAFLPSRVLDVHSETPAGLRLFETGNEQGRYAALSHVWGHTKEPFILTTRNLEAMKTEIDMEHMPKTYRDAVVLSRRLGIRYLWIDALCILQDSSSDWEQEAARMASVYSRAHVVYSVLGSHNDTEGFLTRGDRPTYQTFENSISGKPGLVYICPTLRERAALPFSDALIRKEPLSQRGWTLQERWLAPRILHLGTQQMLFECHAGLVAEDGSFVPGRMKSVDHGSQDNRSFQDRYGNLPRGAYIWSELLVSYTPRALTVSADKLPAISGLVDIISQQTGDDYVAGLWRSNLIEGLLWRASKPHKVPAAYRAPSWSWAAIDGAVGTMNLGPSPYGINEWTDIARVVDCQANLKGRNPFGEVTSAFLIIEASFAPLMSAKIDGEAPCTQMRTANSCANGGHCLFDTTESQNAASSMVLFALLLVRCYRKANGHMTYYGLIITPAAAGKYRRVGLIVFNREPSAAALWLNADFRTLTITII